MSKDVNPFMEQPKKGPSFRWLWTTLLVIFLIVALPVGMVAVLFYDPSHYDTKVSAGKTPEKVFNAITLNMFDGCRNKDNPTIDLSIKEQDMNALFYNVASQFKNIPTVGEFVKQFSFEIYDEEYIFGLEIEAWGFAKTKVRIITDMNAGVVVGKDESNNDIKGFEFIVKDIKVGRMGGLYNLLSLIGMDFSTLINTAGLPLNIKADPNDSTRMYYSYADFVTDLTGLGGISDGMFKELFSTFFTRELIKFGHTAGEGILGQIELKQYQSNDIYGNDHFVIKKTVSDGTNFITAKANDVQKMLNAGVIVDNNTLGSLEDAATAMHQYLCFGADFLSDSEKTYIEGLVNNTANFSTDYLDGKSYGTYSDDIKQYYFGDTEENPLTAIKEEMKTECQELAPSDGFDPAHPKDNKSDLFQKIDDELSDADHKYYIYGGTNTDPTLTHYPAKVIYDVDLHDMIKANKQLVGYGFPFANKTDDNTYKFAYTMVDNLYATSKAAASPTDKDYFTLVFGLNINEAETSLVLPCPAEDYVVPTSLDPGKDPELYFGKRFSVKDATMYYGNSEMNNLKTTLKDMMSGVDKVGDWFTFVKDENGELSALQMDFDANELLEDDSDSNYFRNFHLNMTSPKHDPLTEEDIANKIAFPQGAKLFININLVNNDEADLITRGPGRFEIEVGYYRE